MWTHKTATGQRMSIGEMSDSHLFNMIRMALRKDELPYNELLQKLLPYILESYFRDLSGVRELLQEYLDKQVEIEISNDRNEIDSWGLTPGDYAEMRYNIY